MKRSLILQGGGLRGAFVAGACLALGEMGITDFDSAFAVSASVPTLAYFLTGQYKEGREVWENYLTTKRFIRYSRLLIGWKTDYIHRPLLDTYYLVFQVFRDRFPLDVDRLMASKTEAYFVATDAETFQPHYFKKDPDKMYQIMWACLALPGACPERPIVNGRRFIDGGVADPVPIVKALETGADRFLLILTLPFHEKLMKFNILKIWLAGHYFRDNPGLRDKVMKTHEIHGRSLEFLKKLKQESPEKVFVIAPQSWPPVNQITRKRSKIARTLELGYQEVLRNRKAIERFLDLD